MENTAILNYPGSKRRLLEFIYDNTKCYITNKTVLDIFAGTGCVAKMYKNRGANVAANDTEIYSQNIAKAILNGIEKNALNLEKFKENFEYNFDQLNEIFKLEIAKEKDLLLKQDLEIIKFEKNIKKIWNLDEQITVNEISISNISDLKNNKNKIPYILFSLYYAGSYFGIKQSAEIDSLRYAIEQETPSIRPVLFTCLYYAMKETTFSKDGHMAQPLDPNKNVARLFKVRKKSIFDFFNKQLEVFLDEENKDKLSEVRNSSFLDLIKDREFMKNIGFVYADPPYTDMQYSRYFHLLTTVTEYDYPEMTIKGGKLTTGLYANNRFQSSISNRNSALKDLSKLIDTCSSNNITLCFSYAFPVDRENQPIDRYTMDIDDLISEMKKKYKNVKIVKENFEHCNNRNKAAKKVFEYLIIGEAQ